MLYLRNRKVCVAEEMREGVGTGLVRTLAKEKGWHAGPQGVMAAEAGEERREELGAGGAGHLRIMGLGS